MLDQKTIRAMRSDGAHFENDGKYWDDETLDTLREMYFDGAGITEIAYDLKRNESAIVQQLQKYGCFSAVHKIRDTSRSRKKCKCIDCPEYETCMYSPKNRGRLTVLTSIYPQEEG